MKQTAVEWLEEKLIEAGLQFTKGEALEIEQAKEMEKQQIIDAYESGIEEGKDRFSSEEYNLEYYETAEQYYNEKFKKENNE